MASMWDSKTLTEIFLNKIVTIQLSRYAVPEDGRIFAWDMKHRYENRNDPCEFGLPAWEPTAKQLNYLDSLARKCGYQG